MYTRILTVLTAAAVLAGCAAAPAGTGKTAWLPERTPDAVTAEGRLAATGGGKSITVDFDWESAGDSRAVELSLPLGIGVGRLCESPQGAVLTDMRGRTVRAADSAQLSRQMLGTDVSLKHLNAWINGKYLPDVPAAVLSDGRLQQSGWLVERQTDETGRPKSLRIEKENDPNHTEVRMIIRHIAPADGQTVIDCGPAS